MIAANGKAIPYGVYDIPSASITIPPPSPSKASDADGVA